MKVLAALVLLLAACADDGADPVSSTSAATADVPAATDPCADCRTVAIGNELQDGDTSVGVLTCDDTSCAVSVAAPDGTEASLDLAAGDTLDAGSGWVVVATGADGLTLRPA